MSFTSQGSGIYWPLITDRKDLMLLSSSPNLYLVLFQMGFSSDILWLSLFISWFIGIIIYTSSKCLMLYLSWWLVNKNLNGRASRQPILYCCLFLLVPVACLFPIDSLLIQKKTYKYIIPSILLWLYYYL